MSLMEVALWMITASGDGLGLEDSYLSDPLTRVEQEDRWKRGFPLALDAGVLGTIAIFDESPVLAGGGAYLDANWAVHPKVNLHAQFRHSRLKAKEEDEDVATTFFGFPVIAVTEVREYALECDDLLVGVGFPFPLGKPTEWFGEGQVFLGARKYEYEATKEARLLNGSKRKASEDSDGWTGLLSAQVQVYYRPVRALDVGIGILMDGGLVQDTDGNTRGELGLGFTLGVRLQF
jgi:hypothetical protein